MQGLSDVTSLSAQVPDSTPTIQQDGRQAALPCQRWKTWEHFHSVLVQLSAKNRDELTKAGPVDCQGHHHPIDGSLRCHDLGKKSTINAIQFHISSLCSVEPLSSHGYKSADKLCIRWVLRGETIVIPRLVCA